MSCVAQRILACRPAATTRDRWYGAFLSAFAWDPAIKSEENCPGVELDFNADNEVVAIETRQVRSKHPDAKLITLDFKVA